MFRKFYKVHFFILLSEIWFGLDFFIAVWTFKCMQESFHEWFKNSEFHRIVAVWFFIYTISLFIIFP